MNSIKFHQIVTKTGIMMTLSSIANSLKNKPKNVEE